MRGRQKNEIFAPDLTKEQKNRKTIKHFGFALELYCLFCVNSIFPFAYSTNSIVLSLEKKWVI